VSSPTGDILILGGGPAGLAAAAAVIASGRARPVVIEQDRAVGGLSRTEGFGGLSFDLGSHRYHPSMPPGERDLLGRLLGDDLLIRPRRGGIYFNGRWLSFPLRLGQTWKLGPGRVARWLGGYAWARATIHAKNDGREDCRRAFDRAFGRPMVREFYAPYLEKVFGLDLAAMSPEQYKRRVSTRSLGGVVRRVMGRGRSSEGASGATYFYPRQGIGQPYEVVAQKVIRAGGEILSGHRVAKVWLTGDRAAAVVIQGDGPPRELASRAVVSTIPLPELVSILDPSPPEAVRDAAACLRYRDLVILLVRCGGPRRVVPESFYFPTADVPFNRAFVPANFLDLPREDDYLVGFEFGAFAGDRIWSLTDDELWDLVRPWLDRLGLGQADRVKDLHTRRLTHAYPLYELGFKANLEAVLDWSDETANLITTGRQGRFVHNNMHHSLEMGRLAGEAALEGGPKSPAWAEARRRFDQYQIVD
jgi:protoporphyrinogen oxidase